MGSIVNIRKKTNKTKYFMYEQHIRDNNEKKHEKKINNF